MDTKPKKSSWSDRKWELYCQQALPGRIFFSTTPGLYSWINRIYQRKVLRRDKKDLHMSHTGVILYRRRIAESLGMTGGPTTNNFLDKYAVDNHRLMICKLPDEGPHGDIDVGISKLIDYIRLKQIDGTLGYGWLELITRGRTIATENDICSDLTDKYLWWRLGPVDYMAFTKWDPKLKLFILPNEIIDLLTITFDSASETGLPLQGD